MVVEVAVADGGDRPPEVVVVFGIEHGHEGVGLGDGDQGHEAGAVEEVEVPGAGELAHQRVVDGRPGCQPEAGVLGLPR
jgi:hypothetical protein